MGGMKYCSNCKHSYLIPRENVAHVYGCRLGDKDGDGRLAQEQRLKGECGSEAKLWEPKNG